ncbi:rhomboid family intramembrane serine protease [Terracidiphilus gabretensis]|jgi:rhomboid protease GluP|uniref:rhomboid family intramembrane serine protease n=1 Tax=Terracidiphilus gabretensis TaxID=1577687 RepID=UPI00071BD4B3|nr:rhomboid family intramembrane serine protease [Terracidiphilus gabretensis]
MGSNPPSFHPQGPGYEEPGYSPEILPPGGAVPPPQRPRRGWWAAAPATYVLIGINVAVFVLMTLRGVSPFSPTSDQLLGWGADHAQAVLIDGEWWRLFTAMFVHVGIVHLGMNMWCLWNLGLLAEPLMGSFGVIAVYVLTGAAGNMLSIAHNFIQHMHDAGDPAYPVGAGASGAVFGIAGALIVLLKSSRLPVPADELKKLRRSVITFAAINLVIPFAVNFGADALHAGLQIDYMAHIGGCACGLLFAAPMVPRIGSPRNVFSVRLRTAIGIVLGVLVLFAFFLAQLPRG